MQQIYLAYFSCCTGSLHRNDYYIVVKEVSHLHQKSKKYLKEEILSEKHKQKISKQQKETGMF